MRANYGWAAIGLAALLAGTASAQTEPGSIRVRVTVAGTTEPIEGVQLQLSGPQSPATPHFPSDEEDLVGYMFELALVRGLDFDDLSVIVGHSSERRMLLTSMFCSNTFTLPSQTISPAAVTDVSGNAVLQNLNAGQYSLTASSDGYIGVRAPAAIRPVAPSKASSVVTVEPAVQAQVSMVLVRAGTVAGKVLDSNQAPVANACVLLGSVKREKSGTTFIPGPRTFTNSTGDYRVQVSPGEYALRVQPSGYPSTFFYAPGTTDFEKATLLSIEAGGRADGIDVRLP